ncbi:MAG: hypothetical protein GWO24_29565, partial [Akkermansiaceae bacterium]|nr:hypothetical protein [Akkermansiaceae bacterium]
RAFINGTAHGWIDCLLEEARLYDEALDAGQIEALFEDGPVMAVDSDGDGLPD